MGKRGPSIVDLEAEMSSQVGLAEDVTVDDLVVDDILAPGRRKGVRSGPKGKAAERDICKILNDRFASTLAAHPGWGTFSRSIGSGNRWGQKVQLSQQTMDKFSGDIIPPERFRFVIESKKGYNEIDLCCAFDGGVKEIDKFLSQVSADAKRTGRQPLLIWRKDRKPRIAFVKFNVSSTVDRFKYRMQYGDWHAYLFEDLISLDDDFFFDLSHA